MNLILLTLGIFIPLLAAHPADLLARQDTPETPQCFPDRTNCRICVPWGENGTACVNRGDVCCSKVCRYVPSRAVSHRHVKYLRWSVTHTDEACEVV